jgi:Arc/MetJ-type ribon-helix-helix transcriptional regulator
VEEAAASRNGRFVRASDAIRFAIEELPPELLLAVQLIVAEERFDGDGIRAGCRRA